MSSAGRGRKTEGLFEIDSATVPTMFWPTFRRASSTKNAPHQAFHFFKHVNPTLQFAGQFRAHFLRAQPIAP